MYTLVSDKPQESIVVEAHVKAHVAAKLQVSLYPKDQQRNCSNTNFKSKNR